MPFADPTSLRRELAARLLNRPFTVKFWDGTVLPATADEGLGIDGGATAG